LKRALDHKQFKILFLIILVQSILSLLLAGCTLVKVEKRDVLVSVPGDLYYLSMMINQRAEQNQAIPAVNMRVSSENINELKQGKTDAVFTGREPTKEELAGLKDFVLAYDAVCIILDENTYLGGIVSSGGRPLRKSSGLQGLTTEAVKSIISGQGWQLSENYFEGNQGVDINSWLINVDSVVWIPGSRSVANAFYFPPGKYDTQTVLYDSLGLDEKSMLSGWKAFTSSRFNIEEEVLSYEYNGSNYSQASGKQDFPFKLAFCSRRAMTVAPEHISVKELTINGIDPLTEPESIYDGSYPFSRKIHLLVRQNSSADTMQMADYLLSPEGQQLMAEAGYLPLRTQ